MSVREKLNGRAFNTKKRERRERSNNFDLLKLCVMIILSLLASWWQESLCVGQEVFGDGLVDRGFL